MANKAAGPDRARPGQAKHGRRDKGVRGRSSAQDPRRNRRSENGHEPFSPYERQRERKGARGRKRGRAARRSTDKIKTRCCRPARVGGRRGGGRNRETKGGRGQLLSPGSGPNSCTDPGLDARDSHLAPVHHENSCTQRSLFFVSPLPPLRAPFLIGILSLFSFPSISSFSPRSICSLYPRRFFLPPE